MPNRRPAWASLTLAAFLAACSTQHDGGASAERTSASRSAPAARAPAPLPAPAATSAPSPVSLSAPAPSPALAPTAPVEPRVSVEVAAAPKTVEVEDTKAPEPTEAPAKCDPETRLESAAPADGADVGDRIPEYRHAVQRPGATAKAEELDTRGVAKPTLYIVNSTTCPYSREYADRMKEIETTYMAKGVDVVHVYPVREQTAEDKAKYHKDKGFAGGLVDDADADFAKKLDVHKTPTVILTDAKGVILYRGRIDDNRKAERVHVHELAAAIDEHLAGKPVSVTTTEPFG